MVAERIGELRAAKGWTKQRLADELGLAGYPIDRSAISRIEDGSRKVTTDELWLIAVVLGVSPMALLTPTDPDQRIRVTPDATTEPLVAHPGAVRGWLRGHWRITLSDDEAQAAEELRYFFNAVADDEHDGLVVSRIPG